MPREAPTEQVFDYDSEDVERIGQLLEQVRQHPEQKQAVYQQLDEMIFGCLPTIKWTDLHSAIVAKHPVVHEQDDLVGDPQNAVAA